MRQSNQFTKNSHPLLRRRDLLVRAGLAGLLLPCVKWDLGLAQAASPKRIIFMFSPCGPCDIEGPISSGVGANFTFHPWFKPLEEVKSNSLVVSRMGLPGFYWNQNSDGPGHEVGVSFLTGTSGHGIDGRRAAFGPSIDRVISKSLNLKSVYWGLQGSGGGANPFFDDNGRYYDPQTNPQSAFSSLFGGLPALAPVPSGIVIDPIKAPPTLNLDLQRKTLLSRVKNSCREFLGDLGKEGKAHFENQCMIWEEMEAQIKVDPTSQMGNPVVGKVAACSKAEVKSPTGANLEAPENRSAQMAAFRKQMVDALRCDLARVIGFQFAAEAARFEIDDKTMPSTSTMNSGDSGPQHHAWTHSGDSGRTEALSKFYNWYSRQVALVVKDLKETLDANGKPLIDSTLVVWTTELGGGNSIADGAHTTTNYFAMVFGSQQTGVAVGNHIESKAEPAGFRGADATNGNKEGARDAHRLLVSLGQYMGVRDAGGKIISKHGMTDVSGNLPGFWLPGKDPSV